MPFVHLSESKVKMGKKKTRVSDKIRSVEDIVAPKAQLVKKSVCSCAFLGLCFKTISLILVLYTFSISLTFYNQRFIHVRFVQIGASANEGHPNVIE